MALVPLKKVRCRPDLVRAVVQKALREGVLNAIAGAPDKLHRGIVARPFRP